MMRSAGIPSALLPPAAAIAAAALTLLGAAVPARAQSGLPLPPALPSATAPAAPAASAAAPASLPATPAPPSGASGEPRTMTGPRIDPLAVPSAPPPPPVLPPPIVVPVRPERPPPPATVVANAPGTATAIPGGLQITFGPDRAELSPKTYAALQDMAAAAKPAAQFTVRAYAAGKPSDPSHARRLSLSRALAVRSVLIHAGIASPRIAVLALGAAPPGPAPDRVDVTETQP